MKSMTLVKVEGFEKAATDALQRVLAEVPFARGLVLHNNAKRGRQETDLIAKLTLGSVRWTLVCEIKREPQPGVIRPTIERLCQQVATMRGSETAYGVFIARYVSPRMAQICKEAGVGYLDLAGNCRLSFAQVYIHTVGAKNRVAVRREARSLFSPKAARALRVLLTPPRRAWRVQELAREAEISIGQSSKVKAMLAEREWIRSHGSGIELTTPEAVLREWAANQIVNDDRSEDYYALQPLPDLENALARVCTKSKTRYALAGFSAAMRLAPMVRNQKLTAYVSAVTPQLIEKLGLKPVTSGANVTLTVPGDAGVFYRAQDVEGVAMVSPVQAYLDLRRNPGRGEEAAEAILSQILRPQW